MTSHHIVNNRRRPHNIPIVPGGPRSVWMIARATKAPRKEDMMPMNRISRDGTRRGEARHGSPNSSTSYIKVSVVHIYVTREIRERLTVVVRTIVAFRGVPIRCPDLVDDTKQIWETWTHFADDSLQTHRY